MSPLDQFLANLVESGLVPGADLERARALLAPGPAADAAVRLARLLIDQGTLTSYQARKVLAGRTRGFVLGGYRILKPLGAGGMGKVYLAVHPGDGRRVAIKVLPRTRALEEKNALSRFRREMELSQRIRHPNIARTLEVGAADGVHFMVMEHVPGDSLYNIVKSQHGGPLRVPDTARYFLKVLDGLNAAHQAGLVHRDIKPSNLMVTPDGDAKVLDLGLAKAIGGPDESPLTRPNTVIGTLDYASPEQLGDAARADPRSDLYSIGCTLYFTTAGRPPFEGGDVVNKIYKQRMDDPEPLERVARGVPAAFAAIVRKLMAKDPNDRYQAGQELQADLARWTDPARVRAILGVEAETARAFRPPPPELDEDDLRLGLEDDRPGSSVLSLRDLGDPEPAAAPMHRPPPPPRPAVVLPAPPSRVIRTPVVAADDGDDAAWLRRFILVAVVVGMIAVLAIAIFL
jgi:eukaryotic-like serine/threonine-protein kinase